MRRLAHIALALCRALDILACVIWLSALYPFGLSDRPTGYETISAYVGRAQANGMRWAKPVASMIDWAAMLLGDGPGHCARSWALWARLGVQGGRFSFSDHQD